MDLTLALGHDALASHALTQHADSFVVGFGLSASLIVAIGAQNAFVLRQGLRREHVAWVVGICAALDLLLMGIGVFGLARWAAPHPLLLSGLVVVGAAFLLAYGWSAARRAWAVQQLSVDMRHVEVGVRGVVLQTLALTLLNPHVYLDTVMLVGAVGAQQAEGARAVFLAGAGLASALWFAGLGYGARWLAPLFEKPIAWRCLDALVALTMWVLAVWLVVGWWSAGGVGALLASS
jgi:L-lysine exporter family protein LysE/ArgO